MQGHPQESDLNDARKVVPYLPLSSPGCYTAALFQSRRPEVSVASAQGRIASAGEAWCAAHGYRLVETFAGAGASATNDRRPESQRKSGDW